MATIHSFDTLPPCLGSLVRQYLPRAQTPVSRADSRAHEISLRAFDIPKLKTFPKETFLGRLFCEESSQRDASDARLAQTVFKKAIILIQIEFSIFGRERPLKMKLSDLSYDTLNAIGDSNTAVIETALVGAFRPIFVTNPEIAAAVGILNIPPDALGARIKTWIARRPSNERIERQEIIWNTGSCIIRDTLVTAGELHAFQVGIVLEKLVHTFQNSVAELILDLAPKIHPISRGCALLKAAKNTNNALIRKILSPGIGISAPTAGLSWYSARLLENRELTQLIEQNFSPDSLTHVLIFALSCAVRAGNLQIAGEILNLCSFELDNLASLNEPRDLAQRMEDKSLYHLITNYQMNVRAQWARGLD